MGRSRTTAPTTSKRKIPLTLDDRTIEDRGDLSCAVSAVEDLISKEIATKILSLALDVTGNRRQPNPINSRNPSGRPDMRGRVYTMSGTEDTHSDDLIQGACVINGVSLRVLYDSGAMHSFISNDCVRQLELPISHMTGNLIVSTPAGPSIATSLVCRDCHIYLEGQEFIVNLICLPLSDLDVILGMDWLSANHVMLDCPNKKLAFSLNNVERTKEETQESQDAHCTRDPRDAKTQIFTVFAIGDPKDDPVLDEISIVCEYPEVFPENVPGLPSEREVEFSIDLVPGAGPVSMAPYRMSPVELVELKQQVEELLGKHEE
ncbi:uncharacterized protein LOC113870198 [Abrus precatorius]|uniref:Uncharacterized protein LOC113870198 n=1 Tax=Abrus precatorius TaxID=3816 RepID=A0A8B8M237_ABRPR|nr:uncharacterized protein LOC113870198 [Abrus precatorius]